jgi:hypothetical protein
MPNVDLPPVAEGDFYPLYFSRGVTLEADLMADALRREMAQGGAVQPLRRVVQWYRQGDVGEAAAQALKAALDGSGLAHEAWPVPATDAAFFAASAALRPGDALVLWLRPGDLAALPGPPPASAIFVSGTMGGLEHAPLPVAWRSRVQMTYPFDLPRARQVRMNFPLGWFRIKHIAVVAERVQTATYVACGILAETLTDMLDSFVRDYLVERVEGMLGHRLVNGYYPRLSLGPGQRFASKGGYVVRFDEISADAAVASNEWLIP